MDLHDKHFAVIGAGSQMGPAEELLNLGATVYAIDLPRPAVWQRLLKICRASSGTLVVPVVGNKCKLFGDSVICSTLPLIKPYFTPCSIRLSSLKFGHEIGTLEKR